MIQVAQEGRCSLGLAWEYGRALGRARRRTVPGRLLFFPGAYVLFVGVMLLVGGVLYILDPDPGEDFTGIGVVAAFDLLALLWGLSWCGICRLPAALMRLWRLRGREQSLRFFPGWVEYGGVFRAEYSYGSLLGVWEGKRAFFLQVDVREFLLVQKDSFIQGGPGELRRLLDEKCGRPVLQL